MKTVKLFAWIGLISMTLVLLYGFVFGNFGQDGSKLLSNPWGIVSIVDLYVGFILFSLWIAFREKNLTNIILWIILMMVLGFFAGSLYVLVNIYKSKGDWLEFFLGSRKEYIINNSK